MNVGLRWVGAAALFVASSFLFFHSSHAAEGAAARDGIAQIAGHLEKGNAARAKPAAQALARRVGDLGDVMDLLRLRAKKGLGIGSTAGAIRPDGIEAIILNMGKKAPKAEDLQSHGPDYERAAYVTAAIAEVAEVMCPVKTKKGAKDPQKWAEWSQSMQKESIALAKAIHNRQPAEVKTVATRLNSSCNACHAAFRD